jgi:hypothetical protein
LCRKALSAKNDCFIKVISLVVIICIYSGGIVLFGSFGSVLQLLVVGFVMSNKKDAEKADVPLRFYCTPSEMQRIEDYRFKNRIPVRTQAVRDLIELGLEYAELLEQQKLVGVLSEDKALEDEKG